MRARVTLGALLVMGVALAAVGVGIIRLTAATMVADAQTSAEVQARNLAIVAEAGLLPPVLDVDAAGLTILQVAAADGRVLAASRQLAGMPPLRADVPMPGHGVAATVRLAAPGAAAIDFRVVTIGSPSPEGMVAVSAGVSLAGTARVLARLTWLLGAGFGVTLLAVGATSWAVIGRALRPVEAMRAEVDQLVADDPGRRLAVPPHGDELSRLAVTMNEMLGRLEAAAARQRSFIADASHELRSPLASLRTQLEVTAAHPDGVDAAAAAEEALVDVLRLEALTTDLLALARLDRGPAPTPVVLDVAAAVAGVLGRRRGDRVPIALAAPGPAPAVAVPEHVAQVVTNLVDNAVRHAAGRVDVAVAAGGDLVTVTVADDGPGIPTPDRERVFERFVRLDPDRSRIGGGTGLGLAIAREVARAGGGDVRVVEGGPGAVLLYCLPADAGAVS